MTKNKEWQFQGGWLQGESMAYGVADELYYKKNAHTILKKTFMLQDFDTACLHVAALGYYIGYLNGKRIGDAELNSDWTNYRKRIYYDEYDISSYLVQGENVLTFELGNGMYNPSPLKLLGKYNLRERLSIIGEPKLICDIETDGKLLFSSDTTWETKQGNRIVNNLYLGEVVDFTKAPSSWVQATVVPFNEQAIMVKSFIPKIKSFQSVLPVTIRKSNEEIIMDFGEMISGFIHIKLNAKKNQRVCLKYGESLTDGKVDYDSSYAGSVGAKIGDHKIDGGKGAPEEAIQQDILICRAGLNEFHNKFSYHSFRFVQIQGVALDDILSIEATYVHTDVQQIGRIHSDNDYINELFAAALRTKLNNIHSVFEDCARERLGYGGDIAALADSNLYLFDLEAFARKVIIDFRNDQTNSGGIPETAPYMGIQTKGTGEGEGPILWQLVYPYLTYKHYQFYGDQDVVEEEYPFIEKQLNYLLSKELEEVVQKCIGDHGSPLIAGHFNLSTPDKLFVGYCTILLFLKYNMYLRKILNKECTFLQERYNEIERTVIQKFQKEDNTFGDGTQTSYAFALELGIGDTKKLARKFAEKIRKEHYIFNSGIFGMSLTYKGLHRFGYDYIIEEWLCQGSDISFKKMLGSGNKSLAELFVGDHYSKNHAMFASYQQWYFEALAGITISEEAIGFSKITINPYFSKRLNQFTATISTKNGEIKSSWYRVEEKIVLKVALPKSIDYKIDLRSYEISVEDDGQSLFLAIEC
ncbi:family 78 glycoside hydrolase catalytic domain [Enterococcus sp. AZ192]|uniref:family 78 glycoside hydrolase catalytic domain n=1 Tax=unclassified Enterococcus TaxID=2608891 RepID=UPI003D291D31